MKPDRQNVILEIINSKNIETQNQLMEELSARGIKSTQATLSRDIKDMRLVKQLGDNGIYRYCQPARNDISGSDSRLSKILRESIVSYDIAMNIIVIKTLPGLASAACSSIDSMHIEGLVGTLAGDDTAFLAMKSEEAAKRLFVDIERIY